MIASFPGYADGCMVGDWVKEKFFHSLSVGWSSKNFKLNFYAKNFCRWESNNIKKTLHTEYYDRTVYNFAGRALVQVTATYTFAFGKKIERGNEAYQESGVTSGILK